MERRANVRDCAFSVGENAREKKRRGEGRCEVKDGRKTEKERQRNGRKLETYAEVTERPEN